MPEMNEIERNETKLDNNLARTVFKQLYSKPQRDKEKLTFFLIWLNFKIQKSTWGLYHKTYYGRNLRFLY
jgi:hypothetical protein